MRLGAVGWQSEQSYLLVIRFNEERDLPMGPKRDSQFNLFEKQLMVLYSYKIDAYRFIGINSVGYAETVQNRN